MMTDFKDEFGTPYMKPRIEIQSEKKLIGKRVRISFSDDKTVEFWKSFSSRKNVIKNSINSDLYAIDIYDDPHFLSISIR
ncbi:hypothetical protein [uncultured Sunxiuqinia sp.]|uniref:hypothetical protein n=1 Tax=uncultured Sunxiuqinia sp. TaxID=1573825 RepID=UPI003747B058